MLLEICANHNITGGKIDSALFVYSSEFNMILATKNILLRIVFFWGGTMGVGWQMSPAPPSPTPMATVAVWLWHMKILYISVIIWATAPDIVYILLYC